MQNSSNPLPKSECASEGLQPSVLAGKSEESNAARKKKPTQPQQIPLTEEQSERSHDTIQLYKHFEDMHLHEEILRGVFAYGYENPSTIQQQAVVPCVQGRDVVIQAQSGTGKTATFTIALLQQLDTTNNRCQVSSYRPGSAVYIFSLLIFSSV